MPAQEFDTRYRQNTIKCKIHNAYTKYCSRCLSGSDIMKAGTRFICSISVFFVVAGVVFSAGCAAPRKTEALFTRPELITFNRFAIIGLTPEQEQYFMASYTKTFSGQVITFVERNRLREVLSEQDLLKGMDRLNERTRAKLKELFGVEALIMCSYYDSDSIGKKKLRVRVVDSATGAIVGSVITEAPDSFSYHSDTAVKALKADLQGGS
jgi:hypothetical protein